MSLSFEQVKLTNIHYYILQWLCGGAAGKKLSVGIPALMVAASDDAVLTPSMVESLRMSDWIPSLETKYIQDAGHWVLQEKPDQVNTILKEWLNKLNQNSRL
uniref:AB hydrolase-1 domain-containing protein n=1 Tax=Aplanochytrium stocchinoi TaxID=215587 RepID=A0A7S3LIS5_9STRA|mmetsp:Transcript_15464/g.18324  ORF Transcript_15464/g.18324 Transcript_15464/m.18324 type:complete len:102 (+) Transcript_15464:166-471(+)